MYEINNLQLLQKKDIPLTRILTELTTNLQEANTNSTNTPVTPTQNLNNNNTTLLNNNTTLPTNSTTPGIHINGIGVAGIAVGFIFLFSILMALEIMKAIFVNTKTIDEPLRMGKIEY